MIYTCYTGRAYRTISRRRCCEINRIGLQREGCRNSNIIRRHGEGGRGCRSIYRLYCASTSFADCPACEVITRSRRSHNSNGLSHGGSLGCTCCTSVRYFDCIVVAVARRAVRYIIIMQRETCSNSRGAGACVRVTTGMSVAVDGQ